MRKNRGGYVELRPNYVVYDRDPYGVLDFLWDGFMTLITGGLWVIWIFVREMRRR